MPPNPTPAKTRVGKFYNLREIKIIILNLCPQTQPRLKPALEK